MTILRSASRFLSLCLIALTGQLAFSAENELVLYAPDHILAPYGLGPVVIPAFEAKTGAKIRVLAASDGGQLINRLYLDFQRNKPIAHLVWGLDQFGWMQIQDFVETWGNWRDPEVAQVLDETQLSPGFMPYSMSPMGFMSHDQPEVSRLETLSLTNLTEKRWARKLLIQDPRLSSSGFLLLWFSRQILGESVWSFWSALKKQWLTLAPSWDAAYALFYREEAPLVWSYLSSEAFHQKAADQSKKKNKFYAVPLTEGQPFQVEGAGLLKGAFQSQGQKDLAFKFLSYLISEDVQKMIPEKVWMYPVRRSTPLPSSFKPISRSQLKTVRPSSQQEIDDVLKMWRRAVLRD